MWHGFPTCVVYSSREALLPDFGDWCLVLYSVAVPIYLSFRARWDSAMCFELSRQEVVEMGMGLESH